MAQNNSDAHRQELIRNFIKTKGNIFDDISDISELYDVKKNIKSRKMTKYQYTNVLGIRATQIAHGAPVKIEITSDMKREMIDQQYILMISFAKEALNLLDKMEDK